MTKYGPRPDCTGLISMALHRGDLSGSCFPAAMGMDRPENSEDSPRFRV